MDELIPSFTDAEIALRNGDGDILREALFAFELDDYYYIERVTKAVNALLKREGLTPRQIVSIGRALHGLGRLPLRTPGLDVHLSLFYKFGEGAQSYDLHLQSYRFATESGGYDNFGFGTDPFSGPTFGVESRCREYDGWDVADDYWPEHFVEMMNNELQIEDCSDDNLLDWKHPDGSIFWEWIQQHD